MDDKNMLDLEAILTKLTRHDSLSQEEVFRLDRLVSRLKKQVLRDDAPPYSKKEGCTFKQTDPPQDLDLLIQMTQLLYEQMGELSLSQARIRRQLNTLTNELKQGTKYKKRGKTGKESFGPGSILLLALAPISFGLFLAILYFISGLAEKIGIPLFAILGAALYMIVICFIARQVVQLVNEVLCQDDDEFDEELEGMF